MGDLWLPSNLISEDMLRIIDWELAHFGRPSQDVGHFTAHLWIYRHCYPNEAHAKNANLILHGFLTAYRSAMSDAFDQAFGPDCVRESAIHFGSEILTRTVANFQKGFLYEGLPWDHPAVQEAASTAANHIIEPLAQSTFEALQ